MKHFVSKSFIVTFDQLNASLQKKSIISFKKLLNYPKLWMVVHTINFSTQTPFAKCL